MPRSQKPVKPKLPLALTSGGAIDLHFHGAFGVDLACSHRSTKAQSDLNSLCKRLASGGIAGFYPTLLSLPARELQAAVRHLGRWIEEAGTSAPPTFARPLGLHLEGPYLNAGRRGAHPSESVRAFDGEELERLWQESRGTIRILTLAPELLTASQLRQLRRWSERRSVVLSLGHSQATEEEAKRALRAGFRGLTHAWNALAFHHREPGALGAFLGNPEVTVELIGDLCHVHPTLIQWTLELHPRVAFVSDCVPAAGLAPEQACTFGLNLRVHRESRFGPGLSPNGDLAGGGLLLPEMVRRWVNTLPNGLGKLTRLQGLRRAIRGITQVPRAALAISPRKLGRVQLEWTLPPRGPVRYRVRSAR